MNCLSCAHIDLKESPAHARVFLGHCKFDEVARFKPVMNDRECGKYKRASPATVTKREAWALTQNTRGSSRK